MALVVSHFLPYFLDLNLKDVFFVLGVCVHCSQLIYPTSITRSAKKMTV